MRLLRAFFLLAITCSLFIDVPSVLAAQPVGLYLTPPQATVKVGEKLTVEIWVQNNEEQVNVVQANLNYDPAMLDFLDIDTTGSVFTIEAEAKGGQGEVKLARGTLGTVSGEQFVAKVTFKPKKGGTTTIDFADKSLVVRPKDTKNVLQETAGGTYDLTLVSKSKQQLLVWGSVLLASLVAIIIAIFLWFRLRRHKAASKMQSETTVIRPPDNSNLPK